MSAYSLLGARGMREQQVLRVAVRCDVVPRAHDLRHRVGVHLGAARVGAEGARHAMPVEDADDAPHAFFSRVAGPGERLVVDDAGLHLRALHQVGRPLPLRPHFEHGRDRDRDLLAVAP